MQSRLKWFAEQAIILTIPLFLILSTLYIFTSDGFIHYEYQRLNFPASKLFSKEDLYSNSIQTLQYIINKLPLQNLKNLGIYSEREISHLLDVKHIIHVAFTIQGITGVIILIALLLLLKDSSSRANAYKALLKGGTITAIIGCLISLVSRIDFRAFFTAFHRLFFEGNSWLFPATDSLIQLYPIVFWKDATFGVALCSIGLALPIVTLGWILQRTEKVERNNSI